MNLVGLCADADGIAHGATDVVRAECRFAIAFEKGETAARASIGRIAVSGSQSTVSGKKRFKAVSCETACRFELDTSHSNFLF
jgi:hypothetical protein